MHTAPDITRVGTHRISPRRERSDAPVRADVRKPRKIAMSKGPDLTQLSADKPLHNKQAYADICERLTLGGRRHLFGELSSTRSRRPNVARVRPMLYEMASIRPMLGRIRPDLRKFSRTHCTASADVCARCRPHSLRLTGEGGLTHATLCVAATSVELRPVWATSARCRPHFPVTGASAAHSCDRALCHLLRDRCIQAVLFGLRGVLAVYTSAKSLSALLARTVGG